MQASQYTPPPRGVRYDHVGNQVPPPARTPSAPAAPVASSPSSPDMNAAQKLTRLIGDLNITYGVVDRKIRELKDAIATAGAELQAAKTSGKAATGQRETEIANMKTTLAALEIEKKSLAAQIQKIETSVEMATEDNKEFRTWLSAVSKDGEHVTWSASSDYGESMQSLFENPEEPASTDDVFHDTKSGFGRRRKRMSYGRYSQIRSKAYTNKVLSAFGKAVRKGALTTGFGFSRAGQYRPHYKGSHGSGSWTEFSSDGSSSNYEEPYFDRHGHAYLREVVVHKRPSPTHCKKKTKTPPKKKKSGKKK